MELHAMAHTLHRFDGDVFAWSKSFFTTKQLIWGLIVQIPFIIASLFVLIKKDIKGRIK
jgi:hypothetical protein